MKKMFLLSYVKWFCSQTEELKFLQSICIAAFTSAENTTAISFKRGENVLVLLYTVSHVTSLSPLVV